MASSVPTQRSTRQTKVLTEPRGVQTAPKDCSGAGGRIRIKARNHLPVSGNANKERRTKWREHILACASDAVDQAARLGEYGSWLFTVDVEFFLPLQTKNDIDNLAKPVIDTLFKPGVPKGVDRRRLVIWTRSWERSAPGTPRMENFALVDVCPIRLGLVERPGT
jgi:hypothetical protein